MRIDNIGSQPALQNDISKDRSTPEYDYTANQQQDDKGVAKDTVNTVVSKLNEFSEAHHIQFKLHEDLNEYYVTVVNPETNEVIKEIPPKKMLDMYVAMVEFMGSLVDEKI